MRLAFTLLGQVESNSTADALAFISAIEHIRRGLGAGITSSSEITKD